MLEQQYDEKILNSLISQHSELDKEIEFLGETEVKEHSPGLIQRRETLKGMINTYAQLYCKGLAYAEHMTVSEIEEAAINHKK